MSPRTLTIESNSLPSLRLSPEAVDPWLALSVRERDWVQGRLPHSGDQRRMAWLDSESIEAPHDLWVLYQWSEAAQVVDILRLGHFPYPHPPRPAVREVEGESGAGEDRWENEGGALHH